MAAKRIRVEVRPNIDIRDYHVTATVSAERVHSGLLGSNRHDPFRTLSFGDEAKECTEDTKLTILRFYDIDGVDSVGLATNRVRIERSPAYEWGEIEDDIIKAIKTTVGWQDDEVEVDWLFADMVSTEPVSREAQEAELIRHRAESERYDRMFGDL